MIPAALKTGVGWRDYQARYWEMTMEGGGRGGIPWVLLLVEGAAAAAAAAGQGAGVPRFG